MKQEWRIVHQTKSSSLKRLWIYDGIWQPTDRYMWDGAAISIIGGGAPDTVEKSIAAGADDGTRFTGTFEFDEDDTFLRTGYNPDPVVLEMHIWLRWTGVTIAPGSQVTTGYIKVYVAAGTVEGSPELKIRGVDEEGPLAPTNAAEFDADPLTDAGVDWDGGWTLNAWNQSPSISPVVQELVDSHAFNNSAMMLQIRNDHALSGLHWEACRSFEGSTNRALLHIEFEARIPRPPGYGLDPMIF